MRSLARFIRRIRRAALPGGSWSDGPEAVSVPLVGGQPNPIHRLLDDWRLPWIENRAEVIARVGVTLDPIYQWDTLLLHDAVPLPDAMQSWTASASDRIPPQFPISRFTSLVWSGDDTHANLARIAKHLAVPLGPARIGRRWNTLVATWRAGRAELELIAWPPEWQTVNRDNPAEQRDNRLRTACHVHVVTGFRPALSMQERSWVSGFQPIAFEGYIGNACMARAGMMPPMETEMEYVRDAENLVADFGSSLGLSADGLALIVVSQQLFVMPIEAIPRLEVTRLTPAKGSGGAMLDAVCRTKAKGADGRFVRLAQHSEPDGLNAFAQEMGRRLGCPVDIGPAYPDC
ncbi:hypothetical protein ACLBXM_17695 [Xanthobacteraceae bacterium A53D]